MGFLIGMVMGAFFIWMVKRWPRIDLWWSWCLCLLTAFLILFLGTVGLTYVNP